MNIAISIQEAIENSSWIRKIFEQRKLLVNQYGTENVFDFSIGNPTLEPPDKVIDSLISILQSKDKGVHRYTSNQGILEAREYIARQINNETNLEFTANNIVLCVGAAGGLNVVFRTLCDKSDEVIALTPFFPEYRSYVENYGAKLTLVDTTDDFQIDFSMLEKSINPNTKAMLINSPNNPTGVVYSAQDIRKLGELLTEKSKEFGTDIVLISDEPYKKITYDGIKTPSIFSYYPESIVITSYSKDLALPGERIGYIAISPQTKNCEKVIQAFITSLRILGFVNAPSLFQHMIPMVGNTLVDMSIYKKNRDLLYGHLTRIGFSCIKPMGAFYLFPKSPIVNDVEFIIRAKSLNLLLVPGSTFGRKGHFRLSFCVDTSIIERSLPLFAKLFKMNSCEN